MVCYDGGETVRYNGRGRQHSKAYHHISKASTYLDEGPAADLDPELVLHLVALPIRVRHDPAPVHLVVLKEREKGKERGGWVKNQKRTQIVVARMHMMGPTQHTAHAAHLEVALVLAPVRVEEHALARAQVVHPLPLVPVACARLSSQQTNGEWWGLSQVMGTLSTLSPCTHTHRWNSSRCPPRRACSCGTPRRSASRPGSRTRPARASPPS